MDSSRKKGVILKIVRALPLVVIVVVFTLFVVKNGVAAIDNLVETFYERVWLTTFAFLALFLVKSVSFGLPYTLLYLGIGSIYPLGWALVLNTVGIMVNMQIPYFVGRYATTGITERVLSRFPQFANFQLSESNSSVFIAFLVKFIGLLPHEITNLFLGSLKIPYWPYLVGGVLGLMPGMAATTLLGSNLHQPRSPIFIITVIVIVLLILFSLLLYKRRINSSSQKE
ncbi:MAG: VTT domain-containing protein [Sphaerochaetaceae bacterium]